MNPYAFLADLDSRDVGNRLRLGMGRVRSVDGDPVLGTAVGQCVLVPAVGEWDTGGVTAAYLGEYPPRPGAGVWYATDGVDRVVLGMVAPEGPPTATVQITAATSIANDTATAVAAGSVVMDPWNMSNGTGFKVPVAGLYQLTAQAEWASDADGYRQVTFRRNGSNVDSDRRAAGITGTLYQTATSRPIACAKGDTLDALVRHTGGAALNLNDLVVSAVYVGRRRTSGTGDEILADGGFEDNTVNAVDGQTWNTAFGSSATWTLDTGANAYEGTYALKGVHPAGTVVTAPQSTELFAVVPGERIRVTAAVKTASALAGTANDHVTIWLQCSPDGTPDYYDDDTSTATDSNRATGTSYAVETFNFTIPADCFVARVTLRCATTAANTVWWDAVSVREVIN